MHVGTSGLHSGTGEASSKKMAVENMKRNTSKQWGDYLRCFLVYNLGAFTLGAPPMSSEPQITHIFYKASGATSCYLVGHGKSHTPGVGKQNSDVDCGSAFSSFCNITMLTNKTLMLLDLGGINTILDILQNKDYYMYLLR